MVKGKKKEIRNDPVNSFYTNNDLLHWPSAWKGVAGGMEERNKKG